MKYPIYRPLLAGNEKKYVNEGLDSSWISSKGKFVPAFEGMFSRYIGIGHSVAVCNGTVALHLALVALGIGPGDEVIVPTLTYVASVNAIAYTGARPVFVDSLKTSWQMDPADVARKITPKTKAVLAVHLYGYPCDLDELLSILKKNGLFLIEDCAEAFGTKYKGKFVGNFGNAATFSFFGNKTLTTGEGGMVSTNDESLCARLRHYKGQGLAGEKEYWHDVIGYNYRMTNVCAAIGLAQLEQADDILRKKRMLVEEYREGLKGLPLAFQDDDDAVEPSFWMCSVLVERAAERDLLREHLKSAGIETRPFFCPVHTMPMYGEGRAPHPVAEDLAQRGMNLPSYPGLQKKDLEVICGTIRDFYEK